jgi:Tat protein secretion system quality control protein TatD with DNase activity
MPKYLPITANCLADMLKVGREELAVVLWENANRFFNLPNE